MISMLAFMDILYKLKSKRNMKLKQIANNKC